LLFELKSTFVMKRGKLILGGAAFLAAMTGAFAFTSHNFGNRNIYSQTTAACHKILCNTQDVENLQTPCPDQNPIFTDPQCLPASQVDAATVFAVTSN
jgi:hypothetical protein